MRVEVDNVEDVIDKIAPTSESGSSLYIYLPKKHAGKRLKILVLEK